MKEVNSGLNTIPPAAKEAILKVKKSVILIWRPLAKDDKRAKEQFLLKKLHQTALGDRFRRAGNPVAFFHARPFAGDMGQRRRPT